MPRICLGHKGICVWNHLASNSKLLLQHFEDTSKNKFSLLMK